MLKVSYAGCPGLSLKISAQFAFLNVCHNQNRQIIAFGANHKLV